MRKREGKKILIGSRPTMKHGMVPLAIREYFELVKRAWLVEYDTKDDK